MTFLAETATNNLPSKNNMIAINLKNRNHCRLVTVINNHPWYRSTGKNSGYEGTWFLFGGILEKKQNRHPSGWLIKPASLTDAPYSKTRFFGSKVKRHVHKHSLHKLISFSRFGDIEKICISASLGGGFWLSSEGQKLGKYLRKDYNHYFLSPELIKEILEFALRTDLPLYTEPQQINYWLHAQGVSTVGMLHNESLLFKPG
jgi:hypothetical protein